MGSKKVAVIVFMLWQGLICCKNKSQSYTVSPSDREAIIGYYANGMFDKSLELALKYQEHIPQDSTVSLVIASSYYEKGEYTKAQKAYLDAFALGYLSNSDYFGYAANIARKMKDYKSAFAFYDSVLFYKPTEFQILLSRALTYEEVGLKQNAINDCKTLMKLDSSMIPSALLNIGHIFMKSNQPDSAYPYLIQATALEPNSITYHNLGVYYRQIQNTDSTLLCYNLAVDYSPNNPYYIYERGNLLYTTGHETKACDDWYRAAGLGYDKAELRVKEYCSTKN